jgi:hypothetical protein
MHGGSVTAKKKAPRGAPTKTRMQSAQCTMH